LLVVNTFDLEGGDLSPLSIALICQRTSTWTVHPAGFVVSGDKSPRSKALPSQRTPKVALAATLQISYSARSNSVTNTLGT